MSTEFIIGTIRLSVFCSISLRSTSRPIDHVDHLALEMDVTQPSAVEGVIEAAREKFGEPPSLLVNNAGIARGSLCHLMEEKDFDIVVNVNLKVDELEDVRCEIQGTLATLLKDKFHSTVVPRVFHRELSW